MKNVLLAAIFNGGSGSADVIETAKILSDISGIKVR